MRVASVACELPKSVLTNDDVIQLVDDASREDFKGDMDKTLRLIKGLLRKTGIKERRMLQQHEKPFDYIRRCVHRALADAHMCIEDIDMVIHSSVDRRVAEPGMSFFIANALGMHKAQCFDVLEACSSWVRASSIAQGYLMSGMAKNVLIITAEFGLHEGEWGRKTYKIESDEDLEFSYASYTLGESTTATILTADETPWKFVNETANQFSELCVMPIDNTRADTMLYGKVSMQGQGSQKFACSAIKMAEAGLEYGKRVFMDRYADKIDDIDMVIPHSHSYHSWKDQAVKSGVDVPYYFIFPKTGNLITGSIPAAMALAVEDGSLKRGDRVAAWMAAAGLTFTSFDFVY
jgi:acyl-CoA:acyl-CoA alkyltransferase